MADPTTTDSAPDAQIDTQLDAQVDRILAQRTELKDRHARRLAVLMAEREDLRGVHALADLVSDSLRWSA